MSELEDAQEGQRQYDAVGDEPQPIPEGVNLYWGNGDGREDVYELWRDPTRMEVSGNPNLRQTIKWFTRYGTGPYFTVTIVGRYVRYYGGMLPGQPGVAKIDGTRTQMLWSGQLGGDGPAMKAAGLYVVNRWVKELVAWRWSDNDPKAAQAWDNQGGI
jgi:hypothetical protein